VTLLYFIDFSTVVYRCCILYRQYCPSSVFHPDIPTFLIRQFAINQRNIPNMSGETEELTNDGVSVASNLLWTDNPELEYFRSMMNERMDERIASGLDMNDSLIGDSTLHDMMDGELQMMESIDSNSQSRESFLQNLHSPSRHASVLDTSGLSQAEDDTIDNINTEDGSILAWFSRQRKERARKRAEEDGTLESDPAMMTVRQLNPATGVQQQQQPLSSHSRQQQHQAQSQPQRRFFSPLRTNPPAQPQYAHEDNIEVETSVDNPSNMCIPGFIFVTSEQSSSVQTKTSSVQPSKKFKTSSNDIDEDDDRRKRCLSTKVIILCLVLAVVISGIMLTVIFTTNNSKSKSSSSAQAPGPALAIPTMAPEPTMPPGGFDSDLSLPPAQAPSLAPTTVLGPTIAPNSTATAALPTDSPTISSTVAQTSNVAVRLDLLSPISAEAWLDPASPQSLALSWLVNDSEAETYSDVKLLQRYILATFYYTTNGDNWSQSSISWIVEWSDECTWWGIECNTVGGVRILQLSNENLSGSLPREFQLLSNSLEEVYLNGNKLTGTIPPSIGQLIKLSKFNETGIAKRSFATLFTSDLLLFDAIKRTDSTNRELPDWPATIIHWYFNKSHESFCQK
jgi:hypothetical protein